MPRLAAALSVVIASLIGSCASTPGAGDTPQEQDRPNILLIVADDLGYGDLGVFGGEIETPAIDGLAHSGALFTRFYAGPMCSPTRSMLLTGVDMHLNGLGIMREFPQRPDDPADGYLGVLNDRVTTIATLMSQSGYETSIAGKWHLGDSPGKLPSDRGFERSYVLLDGAANHFDNTGHHQRWPVASYRVNGQTTRVPNGFYSTDFFADRTADFTRKALVSGKPFFAYLAFTAPHWPLQAPKESVDQQRGRYDSGWDVIREQRFARMKSLGLVDQNLPLPPRWSRVPAWQDLSDAEKAYEARLMEIYSAMVSDMDTAIASLLDDLAEQGVLENTVVIFMSDNGADAGDFVRSNPQSLAWQEEMAFDNSLENLGNPTSFQAYHAGWAQAGSVHLQLHKSHTTEGGIRTPLIIADFRNEPLGVRIDNPVTSVDLAETLLALSGADRIDAAPNSLPRQGRSFHLLLEPGVSEGAEQRDIAFEFAGGATFIRDRWKLTRISPFFGGSGKWALYDTVVDPGELLDLSATHPEMKASLVAAYEAWAQLNNVQSLRVAKDTPVFTTPSRQ